MCLDQLVDHPTITTTNDEHNLGDLCPQTRDAMMPGLLGELIWLRRNKKDIVPSKTTGMQKQAMKRGKFAAKKKRD